MWEDLVFLSTDNFTPTQDGSCASEPGQGFQGVKIVSIADPVNPVSVGSVPMECSGAHNATVVPDLAAGRLILYTASLKYSIDPPQDGCDHIIEVPLADPGKARTISKLPDTPVEGCHDVTVHLPAKLLAGGARPSCGSTTSATRPSPPCCP